MAARVRRRSRPPTRRSALPPTRPSPAGGCARLPRPRPRLPGRAGGGGGDAAGTRLAIEQGEGRSAAVLYNNLALVAWLYGGPQVALGLIREGIAFCQRRGLTEMAEFMAGRRRRTWPSWAGSRRHWQTPSRWPTGSSRPARSNSSSRARCSYICSQNRADTTRHPDRSRCSGLHATAANEQCWRWRSRPPPASSGPRHNPRRPASSSTN